MQKSAAGLLNTTQIAWQRKCFSESYIYFLFVVILKSSDSGLAYAGLHLQLKDEKWSRAIESCLKKFGYGFCVVNFEDMKVLKSIITQTTNFSHAVVICPFQVNARFICYVKEVSRQL